MSNPYQYAEKLLSEYGVEEMIYTITHLGNNNYIIDYE